jgi:putative transposase
MLSLPKDRNIHRPLHLYLPGQACYFISVRTCDRLRYFDSNSKKIILSQAIHKNIRKLSISLFSWVIIDNHYHLLISSDGKDVSNLIKLINGSSSYLLNKLENQTGRKIWYQYWDKIIRDEKDFYSHLNYIHQNPIKHGLIKNFDELVDYQYCSYKDYLKQFSRDWQDDCFARYPIINYIKE